MSWRNRPRSIEYCPDTSDYVMFVDENGSNDLKYILRCIRNNQKPDINNIFFTVTGCIIHKEYLKTLKDNILALKYKYWENGYYKYKNEIKRVCFHSRDIRKKDGPFYLPDDTYNNFMTDLTKFLESIETKIISININKYLLCKKYLNPFDPYEVSSQFLIERFTKFLLENNATGIIVLEARGHKEDKILLEHLRRVIDIGTGDCYRKYISAKEFNKSIDGIYFNPKWCKISNHKKSYYGLEIADLFSYPIHSYVRSNCQTRSRPYEVLENKLINYPCYIGFGLKIFP